MSDIDAQLRESFDPIAALYDRARPGYPEAVFDEIIAFAELDAGSRVLELGTGSGKATLPFARRGFGVVGLEPGKHLAQIARARLADFSGVEIHVTSFEEWTVCPGAFDLCFAAQAFHWLDPDRRLQKISVALGRPGTLAIFGNFGTTAGDPAHEPIQAAYRRHAPSLRTRYHAEEWYCSSVSPLIGELAKSRCFKDVQHETFTWRQTLSSVEYCELLNTYSDHSTLPSEQLTSILAAIAEIVRGHGDRVTLDYRTGLFLARAM